MRKIFLSLSLFVAVQFGFAQLSGNYTLDASLPVSSTNYQSFNALASDLNTLGVAGPVTVVVANGTYNEFFGLNQISGASAVNRITIDGSDSSLTTITHDGSTQYGTITLDGSDYITIKNLRIEATGNNGAAVLLTNAANYNIVENNLLYTNPSSTAFSSNFTISGSATGLSPGGLGDYNLLQNNKMRGGYYSVYLSASQGNPNVLNRLVNNDMDSIRFRGVHAAFQDSLEIVGNTIEQHVRGLNGGNALHLVSVENTITTGNYLHARQFAMYIYNSVRVAVKKRKHLIANNMMISDIDRGLFLRFADSVDIWYNSIVTYSPVATEPAVLITRNNNNLSLDVGDIDVQNNIFSAAVSQALQTNAPDTIFSKIENNIYFTGGTNLFTMNGVNYASLAAYKAANPSFNIRSFEGDPQFASATDLHIVGSTYNDSANTSIPIFTDIDGDPRPILGSYTDIGADEYNPPLCSPPTALSSRDVLTDSVTLLWSHPSVSNFQYSIVLSGNAPLSSGLSGYTTADSVGVGGLMGQTNYDFYIRAICGRGDTSIWVQGAPFTTLVTCPEPTALTAFSISADTTVLTWTDNIAASVWEIEYGVTGFTRGNGTLISTSNNPDTITGLTPNTTYQWYIRTICGPADTSSWTAANSFTTPCATITAPFLDGFEIHATQSGLNGTYQCWEATRQNNFNDWNIDDNGSTPSTGTGPSGPYAGSKYLFFEATGGAAGAEASFTSPLIDASSLTSPVIEFYYFMYGDNRGVMGNLYVDVIDGTTVTTVDSLVNEQQASMTAPWGQFQFALAPGTGTIRVVLRATRGSASQYGDIAIDNFSIKEAPSCLPVNNVATSNITSSSADISWTDFNSATEWEVQYGIAGFTLGNGTSTIVTTTPSTTLSGLSAATNYDYYIRAICGPGDTSLWTNLVSFSIPCATFTPTTLPFIEGWESFSGTTLGDSTLFCGSTHSWSLTTTEPDGRARYGANAADISTGIGAITLDKAVNGSININYLILSLDLSAYTTNTDLELTFDYRHHGEESNANDRVWVRGNNSAAWVEIYDLFANQQTTFATVGPLDIDATLTAAGQTVSSSFQIRFGQEDNFPTPSDGYTFDNIIVAQTPTCISPVANTTVITATTTADVNWSPGTVAPAYRVEWDVAGTNPTSFAFSAVVLNDSSYTITGLAPATAYDWQVKALCSATDSSLADFGGTFSTQCVPYVAPYMETFDGLALTAPYTALPICWGAQVGPDFWDVTDGTTNPGAYLNFPNDHTTGSGNYMWIDASSDITGNAMETPLIDMSGLTTPYAGFWFASNNTTNSVNHSVALDVWDGAAWVRIDSASGNSTSWVEVGGVVPSGVPSISQFRIMAIADTGTSLSTYYFNDLGVDDFFVIEDTSSNPSFVDPYYPIATINTEDAVTGVADSLNVVCWTSGTVVGIDLDGNAGLSFYISDQSSGSQEGINVFNFNDISGYVVNEGDSIRVHGSVIQFNGLTEINVDSISIISTNATLPTAMAVTSLDESTEAKYITASDFWFLDSTSVGASFSTNLDLTNGTDTITMRIDSDTDILSSIAASTAGKINIGDTLCGPFYGVGGQFDNSSPYTSGYQIFPMRWSDLTICRLAVGIEDEQEVRAQFSLVPNPSNGMFELRTSGFNAASVQVIIRDLSGRIIANEFINNANSSFNKSFDLSGEANGVYFITITDENDVINKKLIKQ